MSELRRVMCVEDDDDIRLIIEFSLATVGGYAAALSMFVIYYYDNTLGLLLSLTLLVLVVTLLTVNRYQRKLQTIATTAPTDALETSLAYFASTPVV